MRKSSTITALAVIASSVLLFSGCSTENDEGDAPSAEATRSAMAQELLDSAYEGIGSDLAEVLTPVTPKTDVNLYIVSCGESNSSCSATSAAMKEAADTVGWNSTIADGKLSPEGIAAAVRQGIAGGADVIIPVGAGCALAQAAFQDAVNAGVTIIGGGGVDDCEPKLWASERLWLPDTTPQQQWEKFGAHQADYVWGRLDGGVKAIVLNFTTQTWGGWITDGVTSRFEKIGDAEILETIDVSDPETADGSFVQKVTTAILAHPDANALLVPVDGWLSNGLAASLVSTSLDDQLLVVGRDGEEPVLDLIRQGDAGVDATIGFAHDWGAWGSIDTAIRILAGQDPVYIGESAQAIDEDHNLPDSGAYQGSVDYKTLFLQAWGVQ